MSGRKVLREILVDCPSWSDAPVRMREPTVRAWREVSRHSDDQDRTIHLLGFMVLDEAGEPVGVEAILSAPISALGELSKHVAEMIGQGSSADPLTTTNGSITGSPSPSGG